MTPSWTLFGLRCLGMLDRTNNKRRRLSWPQRENMAVDDAKLTMAALPETRPRGQRNTESLATVPESETSRPDDLRKVKIESGGGPLLSSLPLSSSSASPPISPSAGNNEENNNSNPSSRSRSSSPPNSKHAPRRQTGSQVSAPMTAVETEAEAGPASSRADYPTENGGKK
jgi:hypothetical protein